MTTLYDLPEGSGRRFLFGLFGHDHDEPNCEKDGCADCAIILHFDREMREKNLQVKQLQKDCAQYLDERDALLRGEKLKRKCQAVSPSGKVCLLDVGHSTYHESESTSWHDCAKEHPGQDVYHPPAGGNLSQ